jgi:hypothetical protein
MATGIAIMFDVSEPGSTLQAIATIPEFFWDTSLGIYLIVKGFQVLVSDPRHGWDSQGPRVAERRARRVLGLAVGRCQTRPAWPVSASLTTLGSGRSWGGG